MREPLAIGASSSRTHNHLSLALENTNFGEYGYLMDQQIGGLAPLN
jgi:hypothetical protein